MIFKIYSITYKFSKPGRKHVNTVKFMNHTLVTRLYRGNELTNKNWGEGESKLPPHFIRIIWEGWGLKDPTAPPLQYI